MKAKRMVTGVVLAMAVFAVAFGFIACGGTDYAGTYKGSFSLSLSSPEFEGDIDVETVIEIKDDTNAHLKLRLFSVMIMECDTTYTMDGDVATFATPAKVYNPGQVDESGNPTELPPAQLSGLFTDNVIKFTLNKDDKTLAKA